MITITLPEQTEKHFAELAEKAGKTTADLALQALLEKMEDLEDIYLAEQRLEDLRAGRSETVSLEDVMKEYGLEN
ncbi:type II toxin-antitoxin system RelB family antitoxin [Methylomagnum sp.]